MEGDRATDLRVQQGTKIRRMRKIHFTTNFCEMPRKSLSTRSLIFFTESKRKNLLCISTRTIMYVVRFLLVFFNLFLFVVVN